MTMSSLEVLRVAMVPGSLDQFEAKALNDDNKAHIGLSRNIRYARNALYCSAAIAAIGFYGTLTADENSPARKYISITLASAGTLLVSTLRSILYDASTRLVTDKGIVYK